MAGNIGAINVKVGYDDSSFERGIKRTRTQLKAVGKRIGSSAKDFTKWSSVGVAAATAIGAAMVKSQMQTLDSLAKTSDALAIQQEHLQALHHVASLTGTSTEQLNTNLERMQRRLGNVARGQGPTAKALEDVGVKIEDIIDLSADEQLVQLSFAFNKIENAAQRASIANDIFGRDGVRMLKMLEALEKDGLEPTIKDLEKMGVALSRIDTAKVEAANDAIFKASQVLEGIVNKFTVKLSPILQVVADDFTNAAKEANGFGESVDGAFDSIVNSAKIASDSFHYIGVLMQGLEVAAKGFSAAFWLGIKTIAEGVDSILAASLSHINKFIDEVNLAFGTSINQIGRFTESFAKNAALTSDIAMQSLIDSRNELFEMLDAEPPSTYIDSVIDRAEVLNEKLEASMAKIKEVGNKLTGPIGGNQETPDFTAEQEERLKALQESFETEQEMLKEKLEQDLVIANEARAADRISQEEHAALLDDIHKRHKDYEMQREDEVKRHKLNAAQATFNNMAQLMNTGSKKLFKIGKAAAIASAIVDGFKAVAKTMSEVAYPWNIPLAAAQAAASAAQVQGIKKQQFGQSGNVTSFSGGQPSVNVGSGSGPVAPQQNINIALNGSSFGADGIRGLISEINDALGDGAQLNVG